MFETDFPFTIRLGKIALAFWGFWLAVGDAPAAAQYPLTPTATGLKASTGSEKLPVDFDSLSLLDSPSESPHQPIASAISDKRQHHFDGHSNPTTPEIPRWAKLVEFGPTVLSHSHHRWANFYSRLTHWEHDTVKTGLDEFPIGLQPIPERPNLVLGLNEKFLSPGRLSPGFETRTGAVWRPSLWVFGQYRTGFNYFDGARDIDPIVESANRLDLFAQLNLTGTERVLLGLRPLDEELSGIREFTGYDFRDGDALDGWNADVQTLFFEGDFGELFPNLDGNDTIPLDFGFSIGRMPLLAQQGLLINEDAIDAVTLTRNTLSGRGNLNLRVSSIFAWRGINRNSSVGRANEFDPGSKLYGILTESDFFHRTINADFIYVDGDEAFGDLFSIGLSSIRRFHLYENTYNTSFHVLASFPGGEQTDFADQGELIFAQTSWTPHHTKDLIYFNWFWAIDQFTSPARGPLTGNALGQTGILFSAPGLGRFAAPVAFETNNTAGASFGRQFFFDDQRSQIIWEVGGASETKDDQGGALGTALRFQKAIGQHAICILDGFVTKRESAPTSQGLRTELLFKF